MIAKKYLINKDIIFRNRFFNNCKKNLYLKVRLFISNSKTKIRIKRKIQKYEVKSTRIKNYCILTGKGRSVYRGFNLSRHMLRKLANAGELIGVRKSSW